MALERPSKKPSRRQPEPRLAEGEAVGRACPICQTQFVRGETVVDCLGCSLTYHDECWKENSGCGAYGCSEAPETIKPKADEVPDSAWGGEKKCPACAMKIKGP